MTHPVLAIEMADFGIGQQVAISGCALRILRMNAFFPPAPCLGDCLRREAEHAFEPIGAPCFTGQQIHVIDNALHGCGSQSEARLAFTQRRLAPPAFGDIAQHGLNHAFAVERTAAEDASTITVVPSSRRMVISTGWLRAPSVLSCAVRLRASSRLASSTKDIALRPMMSDG